MRPSSTAPVPSSPARPSQWFSSDSLKARVTGPGTVVGVDSGRVMVRARAGLVMGETALAVWLIPVSTVQVLIPDVVLVRDTVMATVVARDSLGRTLSGRRTTLSTPDSSRLAVLASGRISPARAGSHTLRAQVDGVQGEVAVVARALRFDTLAVGDAHACALERDQTIWCWGWGQTVGGWTGYGGGGGSVASTALPVQVAGTTRFRSVTAGNEHTCALDLEGAAWCWGLNLHGELGVGDKVYRSAPTRVLGGRTFTWLQAGGRRHRRSAGAGKGRRDPAVRAGRRRCLPLLRAPRGRSRALHGQQQPRGHRRAGCERV